MTTPVSDLSTSPTSQNVPEEERAAPAPAAEKVRSAGKPREAKRDCSPGSDEAGSSKSAKGAERPSKGAKPNDIAASLVRFIKVTPLPKKADADLSEQDKTSGGQKQPYLDSEKMSVPTIVISRDIQLHGSHAEEKPNWTATTHDMTKDLIHNKVTIARAVNQIPENIRFDAHKSNIETLAQLPFHTLLVKWKLSFNFPAYTPRIVYGILSRYFFH
ncbi:hypothetical protein ElyMa_001493000 [Elysia marginata]|uniref:Uncharacterized protein n=1 Tax=Elysia marginata TaxID=1093978 RepID=A0AAV4J4I1_9GAST|nr:hypothetical protein ElyMa_001493000 [Elysia marginata]